MFIQLSMNDLNRIKVALDIASNCFYDIVSVSSNPFEIDLARENGKLYHLISLRVKDIIDDAYIHPYKKEFLL